MRSPWQRPRRRDARRKAVQRRFQSLNARQSDELPPAVAGSGRRLKPRLSGRFAPGDRLCGRRGSVHAGGRPAKSRPEAISIAERQAVVTSCHCPLKTLHSYLLRQAVETAPERTLRTGRPPLRSPWQRPRRRDARRKAVQRRFMVFEEIIRHSPRRRALHSIAEGFSPTARAHTGCISQSPSITERQAA